MESRLKHLIFSLKVFTLLLVFISPKTSLAQCEILTNDLRSYYSFTGNARDKSGYGYHGKPRGPKLARDRFGNKDQAYYFDGVDDCISGTGIYYDTNAASITVWVKPVDITTWTYYNITRQGPWPANMLLAFQENGKILSFGINTEIGYTELDVPIIPTDYVDDNWHCITASYDGSSMKLYSDGVKIGEQPMYGNVSFGAWGFSIGSMSNSREYFHGWMDELRFYNRAIEPWEVLAICNEEEGQSLNLGLDTVVCIDTVYKKLTAGYYPSAFYLWQDGSSNPTFEAKGPGEYWVRVTDSCGHFSDTLKIIKELCITHLILPNIFTPNGDGVNDLFKALEANQVFYMEAQIYNRWGALVFETNTPSINWDGKMMNGQNASEGVYFWVLRYQDYNGNLQVQNGSVTLVK